MHPSYSNYGSNNSQHTRNHHNSSTFSHNDGDFFDNNNDSIDDTHLSIISLLLDFNADPNATDLVTCGSCLHLAIDSGSVEIVRMLMDGGVNLESVLCY